MAQQTAVEWLYKELYEIPRTLWEDQIIKIFDQAKQMEKEQIIETYRVGVEEDIYNNPLRTGQEYYNETFKK